MTTPFAAIVIGSGSAGLFVALEAARAGPVLLLTKSAVDDCNTRWAQGGIAAALGAHDSPASHLRDTVAAGAGIVDTEAARVLCDEAPGRIRDLLAHGVDFDRKGDEVALGREAAHSEARIVHAGGDQTGLEIERALALAAVRAGVTIREQTLVTALAVERGRVRVVHALDLVTGMATAYESAAVVIATGGAGQLFSHTTNPAVATGDGLPLAFAAGAELMDLEFYQFHPTALRLHGVQPFLISEAVRGEGAVLRNAAGERFMPRAHAMAELAPRDVVARAMAAEMQAEGSDHLTLDCTAITGVDLPARFPGIFAFCQSVGIDIRDAPIPVAPAAHYYMGGVRTDTWGRTTVAGLYACGEVACTGLHGANRLASNSLMETVVYGKRVAEDIARGGGDAAPPTPGARAFALHETPALSRPNLQRMMWRNAGIVRTGEALRRGIAALHTEPGPAPAEGARQAHEDRNMGMLAALLLDAALLREESRGAHYRSDFPARDDERWRRHLVYRRAL